MLRVPLPLLFLFLLIHLPFPRRHWRRPVTPRIRRWLERLGVLANCALPGSLWIARGRILFGALASCVVPLLLLLFWLGKTGGLLLAIGAPGGFHVFGQADLKEVLVSPAADLLSTSRDLRTLH